MAKEYREVIQGNKLCNVCRCARVAELVPLNSETPRVHQFGSARCLNPREIHLLMCCVPRPSLGSIRCLGNSNTSNVDVLGNLI